MLLFLSTNWPLGKFGNTCKVIAIWRVVFRLGEYFFVEPRHTLRRFDLVAFVYLAETSSPTSLLFWSPERYIQIYV